MQTLELLAPAKDLSTGIAAFDCGADAVYIGAAQFGARAAAANSLKDIEHLCRYAHRFQARVYATVNTMLHDDELPQAVSLIHDLYHNGVDAVLIQDLRLLNADLPPIGIHASTQCDTRSADDIMRLYRCGIRRVVLARELTLEQIQSIRRQVPDDMELEVFVHGALCVSYSGRCYSSEYCFQRSANRGECAQLCRLKVVLTDKQGKAIGPQAHYLSLKDMSRLSDIQALAEAGVASFKIEGRLKDIPYVRNVTTAYHQAINSLCQAEPKRYSRTAIGDTATTFTPDIQRTFNRRYTDYFLHQPRTADVWSPLTPKALGQAIGTVIRTGQRWVEVDLAPQVSIANGDGLCYFDDGQVLQGFRVNSVQEARLSPFRMPGHIRPGTTLYRNEDTAFEQLLTKAAAPRTIPIQLTLSPTADGFMLKGEVLAHQQTIAAASISYSFPHQTAQQPQVDNMVRQLSRWGGTAFSCRKVEVTPDMHSLFLPSSTLSDMRRQLCAQLEQTLQHRSTTYRDHLHHIYNKEHASAAPHIADSIARMPRTYQQASADTPLMQCRFCLRQALGACAKHPLPHGTRPIIEAHIAVNSEPLLLELPNGRQFSLHFDCQHCQMNIYAQQ